LYGVRVPHIAPPPARLYGGCNRVRQRFIPEIISPVFHAPAVAAFGTEQQRAHYEIWDPLRVVLDVAVGKNEIVLNRGRRLTIRAGKERPSQA
jgi:hypothetical protein